MKRLVGGKKKIKTDKPESIQDEWLGKSIEIINPESKLFSYRGIVNKVKDGKYTLALDPEPFENTDVKHHIYVMEDKMYKWVRILPEE